MSLLAKARNSYKFILVGDLVAVRIIWVSIRYSEVCASRQELACEPQTHFRSSREATTGNASALRRLARVDYMYIKHKVEKQ